MATVTGLTAARMLEIEAASVVDGDIVAGNLILTKHDGSEINAGAVVGPVGPQGPPGVNANAIPGEVKLWPSITLPDVAQYGNYAWAAGGLYDIATYPKAAANIDAYWNTALGAVAPPAGKFRVPDLRGLTVAAPDAMPSGSARVNRMTRPEALTMGVRTGEEKHKLVLAELANHGHGTNETSHIHNEAQHSHTPLRGKFAVTDNSFDGPIGTLNAYLPADPAHTLWFDQNTEQGGSGTTFGATTGLTVQNSGGDGVHENVQPTIFVPYIVKLDD
jgi:microcystin-dependent protein